MQHIPLSSVARGPRGDLVNRTPTIRYCSKAIDWFRVITNLQLAGVTLDNQARYCGVSHGTVSYWKGIGTPKQGDGKRLIKLYMVTFPKDSVPIVRKLTANERTLSS